VPVRRVLKVLIWRPYERWGRRHGRGWRNELGIEYKLALS
jgi:hypothetical protein